MNALVLTSTDGTLEYREIDEPRLDKGMALISLRTAALNRRDYWITQGLYPGIQAPCVLGSDGAGVVESVGEGVEDSWIGREVLIYPGVGWGSSELAQGEQFRVLGMPDQGTFAERLAVPADQLVVKPSALSWEEGAALPVAGLTAYRALFTQGQLQSGQTVLITGAGGGVAALALQMAVAAGARVLVTSSSPEKLARAADLGALAGADYSESGWAKTLGAAHGPVHLVIDGAGGEGFNDLISLVDRGGRIVSYGATKGPPAKIDLARHFWKQLHLVGCTMGSPREFREMLDLVSDHQIKPAVDSALPLSRGAEAVASMASSPQFGKVVLQIGAPN